MARVGPTADKGWAWVVLTAVFCNNTMLGMLYPSVTIFYVKFLEVYGESRSYTSWLGALNTVFMFSSGSLASFILPTVGAQNVFFIAASCLMIAYVVMSLSHSLLLTILSYGVLGGTGFGFMLTGGVAAITKHFRVHLYRATSIAFVGGGLGTLLYGPLLEWLIVTFGWRGAALLYAGISAHILVVGCVVFPDRQTRRHSEIQPLNATSETVNQDVVREADPEITEIKIQERAIEECLPVENSVSVVALEKHPVSGDEAAKQSQEEVAASSSIKLLWERFSDCNFWCLSYIALTWGFTITAFIGIFKDLVADLGLLPQFQLAATISGVANIVSRALVGFLSFDSVILSFAGVFVTGASVTLLFSVAHQYWLLLTSSWAMGLFLGATFLMVPTSVGAVYGRKEMAVMYGYVLFGVGITSWIGPYLLGYLRDLSGTYNSGLYLLASIQYSGALVAIILKIRMRNAAANLVL